MLVHVFDRVLRTALAAEAALGAVRAQSCREHGEEVANVLHFSVASPDVVVALQNVLEHRQTVHAYHANRSRITDQGETVSSTVRS